MKNPSARSILRKYGIRPKKRLGQHFLCEMPTIKKIVDSIEIDRDDIVLEIGPGPGFMTRGIAGLAKTVYAVEKDASLIDIAKSELADCTNIVWIDGDILGIDPDKIAPAEKLRIAGNLPYNISSQIVFWMIEHRCRIRDATIMLQKEVAGRICAKNGGKDFGILSVMSQAFARCERLFDISRSNFVPPPDVTSSIIRMDFQNAHRRVGDCDFFSRVVRAAFGKRRKTLRNALLGSRDLMVEKAELDAALLQCGIDGRRRPEALSVDEFISLADALNISAKC